MSGLLARASTMTSERTTATIMPVSTSVSVTPRRAAMAIQKSECR